MALCDVQGEWGHVGPLAFVPRKHALAGSVAALSPFRLVFTWLLQLRLGLGIKSVASISNSKCILPSALQKPRNWSLTKPTQLVQWAKCGAGGNWTF